MTLNTRKTKVIFEKILTYLLIAVFTIRLFSYKETISQYIGLDSSIYSSALTTLLLFIIWFDYANIMIIVMRSKYDFKTIKILSKYFVIFPSILKIIFVLKISYLLQGYNYWLLPLLLIIEALLTISLSIYYIIIDYKEKVSYKDVLKSLGIYGLLLIPTLPSYFCQFLFGFGRATIIVKDLSFAHRVFLYVGFILPVALYFILRNKKEDIIRFSLIYICVTTMIGFLVNYSYQNFLQPWSWPFHLCNTAMFILPICIIFRMNRLFYFTYFINVLGALLAMLMPNYDTQTNILSMRVFNFWYNHWIAFFMPLLFVALKQFKRPKIKQFYYSMVWFFGYFVLAIVLNVVFTAFGHEVDFFFLNSNYVADKLGNWAENLFNLSSSFTINGLQFVFHPFYQLAFFAVYVLLGLAVWFVYNEFFIISDNHYELMLKLKQIKSDEYAYKSSLSNVQKEQIMNTEIEAKIELKHVSKKYASNKKYAVRDANLIVHKGEIFGFLGPNGAGKSTIIKSLVGIQPISEGTIEVCGFDVSNDPVNAKSTIGYVPDHYALYEKLTGREYINYIADIYEVSEEDRNERIEKYINLFELEKSIDSKIMTYSHGMKQKITIMAALVHNPKVWILDEPLTGLDPNSIYQVKECMKMHAAEGNIVFFSSHIIDIVEKLCERIAIIKHGNIECVKTINEIEKSGVSLEEFYLKTIGNNEEKE